MSFQNIKNSVGSLAMGGAGSFCTTAFMSAMYGIGYVATNWLGASHDLSVVGGAVSLIGLGTLSLAGGALTGLVGVASVQEKFDIYDVKGWPLTAGIVAGAVGGFKAAAFVGSMITFDNDRDTSHLVPTESEKPTISYTI